MESIMKVILCFVMMLSLVSCSNNEEKNINENQPEQIIEASNKPEEYLVDTNNKNNTELNGSFETPGLPCDENSADETISEAAENVKDNSLSTQQINSIVMLNYLSVLTENIMLSPNNRLILESSYSTLYNNIFPNSVDKETQEQITNLMRTINSLEMNDIKRSRIQYLYDQGQAQAMRNAIPSPLAILSVVQSNNKLKAIVSVASLALNSYMGYKTAISAAEMQFLQSDWEIQDNEKKYLDNARIDSFNYLMDIVRDNELPGELALNANLIDAYLEKKNSNNIYRNLQFLENNYETYKAYYGYWLFLADMYYQTGDYSKCLDAFQNYEDMNVRIFQRNHDLAEVLPSIICASQEILNDDELIAYEEKLGKMLMDNASVYVKKKGKIESKNDWALKYFAIQTYLDLYGKTKNVQYLNTAYTWTWTVIDELIDIQRDKNQEYLSDLVLMNEKKGTDEEKKEAKKYNSILKENRKIELPPVYEPLLLNCQLLFAISDKLNISDIEKIKVDKILHPNDENLFLSNSIDDLFWMSKPKPYDYTVSINKNIKSIDLCISANLLGSCSNVEIVHKGTKYADLLVEKVDRNEQYEISKFKVSYQSETFNKVKFEDGDKVVVYIYPCDGTDPIKVYFVVEKNIFSTKFELQ